MVWKKKTKQDQEVPIRNIEARPVSSTENSASTRLGATLVIHGEIRCDEDMLVSGRVIGKVQCSKQITVAGSGYIEGEVVCRSILISGEVKGDVEAKDGITIEATGRLRGDITTKVLTNHPGGFFEGYSHMMDGSLKPPKGKMADTRRVEASRVKDEEAPTEESGEALREHNKQEQDGNGA